MITKMLNDNNNPNTIINEISESIQNMQTIGYSNQKYTYKILGNQVFITLYLERIQLLCQFCKLN